MYLGSAELAAICALMGEIPTVAEAALGVGNSDQAITVV